MKYIIAFVFVLSSFISVAQQANTEAINKIAENRTENIMVSLTGRLRLSEAQLASIKPIVVKAELQKQLLNVALKSPKNTDIKVMDGIRTQIDNANKAEIKAITDNLTEQQLKLFTDIKLTQLFN